MLPASADMRTDPTFREFLQTMRERCVSNATLLRIFTPLAGRNEKPGLFAGFFASRSKTDPVPGSWASAARHP